MHYYCRCYYVFEDCFTVKCFKTIFVGGEICVVKFSLFIFFFIFMPFSLRYLVFHFFRRPNFLFLFTSIFYARIFYLLYKMNSLVSIALNYFEVVVHSIIQGLGIYSLGVTTFFWVPVFSIILLFILLNFVSLTVPCANFFIYIFYLRVLLVFLALANLLLNLVAHSLVISYSFYGLSFFKDLCSLHFFGPAQNFTFVLDEFVSFFILLNSFVIFCCLIFISSNKTYVELTSTVYRAQLLLLTQFFANLAFTATDMLGFYVFYEAILIPVFFLIGIWGSSQRRIKAAYFFFFFYTNLLNAYAGRYYTNPRIVGQY